MFDVAAHRTWCRTDPVVASLSLPPSEYIRRAVRFTPFATENAGVIIREGGPELSPIHDVLRSLLLRLAQDSAAPPA